MAAGVMPLKWGDRFGDEAIVRLGPDLRLRRTVSVSPAGVSAGAARWATHR
jgi:hypothetical protein